ncbi:DUF4127 family protein [Dysosmobacter sp. Sow4_B12]|uniref:DUF4127 family protein n=1 Tax=Dysosmobacter sp. Sow4_B12 TaxID=3438777 RepID=UPI003F92D5E2
MKKRILAAALACVLLAGCGVRTPAPAEETPEERPVIAYVPLDDRPDNVERVVYLAESVGYSLAMPEADLYRTRLDGQPTNENGTQYGDIAALYEWVLDQEAAGCDRYILSMDQLLSGGLVNSRHTAETLAVTLSDGTVMTDRELLGGLLTALAADENNRVWLLDSVMRLAPTVGYAGFGIEEYNALRAYGAAPRKEAAGAELTVEAIAADYRLGSGEALLRAADFGLTEEQADTYLSARRRKLELSDRMMEVVSGREYGNFRVLIGIDDSSAEECIQKNEIAYLRSRLRAGDALLSGVDDLAFKAVAKLYLEERGWSGGTAAVRYFGGSEKEPACAYDFQPLDDIMEEHLAFFALTRSGNYRAAGLQVLVLTQPQAAENSGTYYTQLIEALKECRERGWPTILIDAGNGAYGTAFHEALTEQVELGWLLSYAGFLDMAIVTGTALSHGVARYAHLEHGETSPGEEKAFAKTLADSILKDFCYKNVVREDLLAYIRNDLGASPDNFWNPDTDRETILRRLEQGMEAAARSVVKNLERSNCIVSLDRSAENGGLAGWGGVELSNYRFPWDRAFEIGMDIEVGDFTKPHKSVLGVYYQ